jgi:hypothetical protein
MAPWNSSAKSGESGPAFSSLGCHLRDVQPQQPLYIASLNHCIWFHRAFSPDQWMHFESESPGAEGGRGLSIARIHDRNGLMLATATRETLMVHPGALSGASCPCERHRIAPLRYPTNSECVKPIAREN